MSFPTSRWLILILVLGMLGAVQTARACSCIGYAAQGFIHHDATVLPANAHGALFLAPAGMDLAPARFSVTDASGAVLAARIEPVVLPAAHPMRARLPARERLVRVGVKGGFVPGAGYTMTFKMDGAPVAHPTIRFRVDHASFDLSAAGYGIVLDGPARRTVLEMENDGGMCSSAEPVLVQDFHVRVPDAARRYLPALGLFGEARDAVPGAAFEPLAYRPTLCTPPLLDRSVLGAARDLVVRSCHGTPMPVDIRAQVGMLEVDERVVSVAPARADLGAAQASSCMPFALLREAIEGGDMRQAAAVACRVPRSYDLAEGTLDLARDPVPTRAQWLALAHDAGAGNAACAASAMNRMLIAARSVPAEMLATYLLLAAEVLRGPDPHAAVMVSQLSDLRHAPPWRREDAGPAWLLPLLPDLLRVAEDGRDGAFTALDLIGALGRDARPAAPRLMRLAAQDRPQAGRAIHALARIVPDDPGFLQSLPVWGGRPATREAAALAFNKVAGAARPREALALLIQAAQAGSAAAMDALAEMGPAAAQATPMLLATLTHDADDHVRGRALRTLLRVAPDEAPAADALAGALLAPGAPNLDMADYAGLARFGTHAAAFVPVLERLTGTPCSTRDKRVLHDLIQSLPLPPAQQARLQARLARKRVE